MLDAKTQTICITMNVDLIDAKKKWKTNKILKCKSKLNVNSWFTLTRKLRILNTFSELNVIKKIIDLSLIEKYDNKQNWIKLMFQHSYVFRKNDSSYEKFFERICKFQNCSKLTNVYKLIHKIWNFNEKIVFCIMKSTNVLIFYWIKIVHSTKSS